jgi:hypothetical protein
MPSRRNSGRKTEAEELDQLEFDQSIQSIMDPKMSKLVRYAVEKLDGRFTKRQLAAAFGPEWTDQRIKNLAIRWEEWGLLVRESGRCFHARHGAPRMVTPALRRLAGI